MKGLVYVVIQILILELVDSQELEYYPSQSAFNGINPEANLRKVISKRDLQSNMMIHFKESNANTNEKFRHFYEKNDIKKGSPTLGQFDLQAKTGNTQKINKVTGKRAVDPVFHGHPKTKEEIWNERFIKKTTIFDQTPSLIKLVHNITMTYLYDCTPVILYDNQVKSKDSYLFQDLLKDFPVTYVHGYINDKDEMEEPKLLKGTSECLHFIIFLYEVGTSAKVLGKQSDSKVVVIARSSQWAVHEFLAGPLSRMFINLLVIGQSFKEDGDYSLVRFYISPTINCTKGISKNFALI